MKETNEALRLENSFVWFRNLDTSENSLNTSEMWCSRRTEKFRWTDRMKNGEVSHRVKKNTLHHQMWKRYLDGSHLKQVTEEI